MTRDIGKRRERPEEDIALLEQIQDANAAAAIRYLEYLVLQRRTTVCSWAFHSFLDLLSTLYPYFSVKGLAHAISTVMRGPSIVLPSRRHRIQTLASKRCVKKIWTFSFTLYGLSILQLIASSYASSRNDTSFVSYFASTTPESEHKRARLKTILILAGSSLYDPETIRQQLLEREKILEFELAIIDGKVCSCNMYLTIALTISSLANTDLFLKSLFAILETQPPPKLIALWEEILFHRKRHNRLESTMVCKIGPKLCFLYPSMGKTQRVLRLWCE